MSHKMRSKNPNSTNLEVKGDTCANGILASGKSMCLMKEKKEKLGDHHGYQTRELTH